MGDVAEMSYHSWLCIVRKSCRHFYLRKVRRLFGDHILGLVLEDRVQLRRLSND